MAYYLNLFSPETYEAFGRSDRTISGFRPRQHNIAGRVQSGDLLVCYMTRLSRWVGLLEVVEGPFHDSTPIFSAEDDPFTVRFRVKSMVWLPLEKTVPIHAAAVWQGLSFTQRLPRGSIAWTGRVRGSLSRLSDADGAFLQAWLHRQAEGGEIFPIDADESRKLTSHRVRRADKDVTVTVPDDVESEATAVEVRPDDVRESIKIQALLAEIGSRMGMQIWVPRGIVPPCSPNGAATIRRCSSGCR